MKLVDPATEPQEPATNWAPLVIGLALIVGLGAGVTGAVVLDRTDRRVQYPEDVTSTMGLNILGVVPHLGRNGHAKHHEGVLQVLEAVRAIRLNVLHAHGVGPAIVTVTSPGRADGNPCRRQKWPQHHSCDPRRQRPGRKYGQQSPGADPSLDDPPDPVERSDV